MTFFYCDDRAYEHFLSQECEVSLYDWRFLSLIWLFSDKCMHTQIAEQLQFSKKNRTFTIGNVRRQRK